MISHGVEILIAGGVGEMVRGPKLMPFFFFSFFFFFFFFFFFRLNLFIKLRN